jgi:hypothetical protein
LKGEKYMQEQQPQVDLDDLIFEAEEYHTSER